MKKDEPTRWQRFRRLLSEHAANDARYSWLSSLLLRAHIASGKDFTLVDEPHWHYTGMCARLGFKEIPKLYICESGYTQHYAAVYVRSLNAVIMPSYAYDMLKESTLVAGEELYIELARGAVQQDRRLTRRQVLDGAAVFLGGTALGMCSGALLHKAVSDPTLGEQLKHRRPTQREVDTFWNTVGFAALSGTLSGKMIHNLLRRAQIWEADHLAQKFLLPENVMATLGMQLESSYINSGQEALLNEWKRQFNNEIAAIELERGSPVEYSERRVAWAMLLAEKDSIPLQLRPFHREPRLSERITRLDKERQRASRESTSDEKGRG